MELILADTSTDEDVFINDMLVKEGHALFTYQVNSEDAQSKPRKPKDLCSLIKKFNV